MYFSSIKEINRLLRKGTTNIYIKVTKVTFLKLRFSKFKKFVSTSVFGELQLTQTSLNFQTSCCNLRWEVWEQQCVWLFCYFNFERHYDVLKLNSPCFLFFLNKNKVESKMGNPNPTLRFSSYKNRKSKLKLWRIGARERKKSAFFVTFILSEGNFF